jgi:hypothetical protein
MQPEARGSVSLARNISAHYAVHRATAAEAFHIGERMRPVDRAEIEALEGRVVREFLVDAVAAGARTLMILGEPIVLYGVVACDELPGHAMPWLVTNSTIGHDELTRVIWMSRLQVELWQRRWPVLQMLCDCRNGFRRQWLEWLGFEHGGHLKAFGAAGLPFDLFIRRRHDGERASSRLH